MISRGSLVKTVYNTHALHSAAAATAVASSTAAGPTTGVVTPTSPVSGPPSLPATAPDSTQTAADSKRQEIDAILKQRELLAAEVKCFSVLSSHISLGRVPVELWSLLQLKCGFFIKDCDPGVNVKKVIER